MSFTVYKGNLPKGARPGRGISEETQEVLDALTESAKTGMPVQFSWDVVDGTETENEKRRIRGIAFKNHFSCSLWVKEGKIILKATVKENGGEAGELVRAAKEAEHTAEVLAEAAKTLNPAKKVTPAKKAPAKKVS